MEPEAGPAEYLFQNPKYHDCYLTVGDPATGNVEKIGVSVRNLAAHSTVFRHLLVESDLADPTGENTKITDVTPEVFKLMLIHVYGEQLPAFSKDTAVELLMCADKYNIKQLVSLTCGLLKPESVDQVFPALRCVSLITLPELESSVQKIIQEETDLIINHRQFLTLDDNSVEYITKQNKLAITEIDLWKALVKWGLKQGSEDSLRQILMKPLKHVRLLTLTQDEFLKEGLANNVLTPEETLNILKYFVNNQCLDSPGLCTSKIKREYKTKTYKFSSEYYSGYNDVRVETYYYGSKRSDFTITIGDKDIEILSLTCQTVSRSYSGKEPQYKCTCSIIVNQLGGTTKAVCIKTYHLKFEELVVSGHTIRMPLKLQGSGNLVLTANTSYNFELNFQENHPNYRTYDSTGETTFIERGFLNYFKLKFNTRPHVVEISYSR